MKKFMKSESASIRPLQVSAWNDEYAPRFKSTEASERSDLSSLDNTRARDV